MNFNYGRSAVYRTPAMDKERYNVAFRRKGWHANSENVQSVGFQSQRDAKAFKAAYDVLTLDPGLADDCYVEQTYGRMPPNGQMVELIFKEKEYGLINVDETEPEPLQRGGGITNLRSVKYTSYAVLKTKTHLEVYEAKDEDAARVYLAFRKSGVAFDPNDYLVDSTSRKISLS